MSQFWDADRMIVLVRAELEMADHYDEVFDAWQAHDGTLAGWGESSGLELEMSVQSILAFPVKCWWTRGARRDP